MLTNHVSSANVANHHRVKCAYMVPRMELDAFFGCQEDQGAVVNQNLVTLYACYAST